LQSRLVSRGLLGELVCEVSNQQEYREERPGIRTAHPSEEEADDLAADDGEVAREEACKVTADGDGVAGKVRDECCKCLVSINITDLS
jgi:hypothetical protein